MKPFNLELAKAGYPVCTRDGRKARIICFDKKGGKCPILALVEYDRGEDLQSYPLDGIYELDKSLTGVDLMMVSKKKEGWINIYEGNSEEFNRDCVGVYNSKEEALEDHISYGYITTIKIEWEE